ncbi:MAG: sugar ABC transporter ATP-binding protein [Desulfobacterales bacterium]
MAENIVEMQKVSKAFPGVLALDKVDFSCLPGEVHAVVGENGAGKSTLMKILAGVYRPDGGNILVKGEKILFSSPKHAQNCGISIIYQEFNLIPELTVAENIFLGREPTKRGRLIDSVALKKGARDKTIIYISHRIEEIFQIADRTTILKDGQLVGTYNTGNLDKPQIVNLMVGRSLTETFPAREVGEKKEVLSLDDVCRGNILRHVSFKVYSGEILGLAGLVGSGRSEIARAIFGAADIDNGRMLLNGSPLKKVTPRSSIAGGIGYVTENRGKDGLVYNMSVRKNLTLTILDKIKKWVFVREAKEKDICRARVQEYDIVTAGIEQEIQYLSGGNQQKVILAKWININPSLLILDEPTRGIDVGAKAEIYRLMRRLAMRGTAIIMISSELPEIIGMSDRILVIHDGKVMGELSPSEATEERILMLATGQNFVQHQQKEKPLAL